MKWDATEPQQGRFTFATGDAITDFARAHGQSVRGHTLVWHSQLPGWVAALDAGAAGVGLTNHIQPRWPATTGARSTPGTW